MFQSLIGILQTKECVNAVSACMSFQSLIGILQTDGIADDVQIQLASFNPL